MNTIASRRLVLSVILAGLSLSAALAAGPPASSWRTDAAWNQGKAEWALYDAVRPIYGAARRYEATLFTNKQHMDHGTTTKADEVHRETVEVFKHNLSEMIPTPHYTYRFVTTCFVESLTLRPYKVVASTQEDCGTSYRQFVLRDGTISADQFCYFPDAGSSSATYVRTDDLAFHDALSLTLRDYPFDAAVKPVLRLDLVPDQTDTRETLLVPAPARVSYVGRETLSLPYGAVDAHHLRVTHERDGGVTRSEYWFAAETSMRHVMVKYEGPYGVRYQLKKLGWWAYWNQDEPAPE